MKPLPKHLPSLAVMAALITATPASAAAKEGLLTLQAAERAAQEQDEGIRAAESRRDGLAARAEAAGELPDPRLSLALQNLPTDNYSLNDSPMTQTVVTLSQTLPPGDTLDHRAEAARAQVDGQQAAVATTDRRLRREIRRLWLDIYRQVTLSRLLEQERRLLGELLDSARTAYQVGEASGSDLVMLQARLSRIADTLDRRRGDADAARARLARWAGDAAFLALPDELPQTLRDSPEGSIDRQPELARLRADLAAARAEVAVAEEQFAPEVGEIGRASCRERVCHRV